MPFDNLHCSRRELRGPCVLILVDFEVLSTSMVSEGCHSASKHRCEVKDIIPDPLALGGESPWKKLRICKSASKHGSHPLLKVHAHRSSLPEPLHLPLHFLRLPKFHRERVLA